MKKLDGKLPSIAEVQMVLMLFSQTLSTQLLVYPLALLSVARNATKTLPKQGFVAGSMVIGYVALSILFRGGSVELLVKLMQFYFGVILLTMTFMVDRSLRIGTGMIWLFVILVLYEVASFNLMGVEPFLYSNPDLASVGAAARANLGFGWSRAFGPALNSSVSGSILAIMFFVIVSRSRDLSTGCYTQWAYLAAPVFLAFLLCGVGAAARANLGFGWSRAFGPALNSSVSGSILAIMFFVIVSRSRDLSTGCYTQWAYLAAPVFLAFLLCGSATSYMVFTFLLLCQFAERKHGLKSRASRSSKSTGLWPALLAFCGMLGGIALGIYFLADFFSALIEAKMNVEYFEFIWNLKSEQASQALSFSRLLFGADLVGVSPGNTGGDFVLLDALVKIGLLGMLGLFALLYAICPKENRLFLLAGWLSSMQYGTIFSLCGQVF
jgi:hypothetical protein